MEKREEKKLVKEVQAGSQEAFGRLYDTYIDSIYRFIYLKTSSKEDAQDLTSQVFLRVWEALSRKTDAKHYAKQTQKSFASVSRGTHEVGVSRGFRGIRNFRAFLYQIARNLVIDYWREKGQKGDVLGREADIAETAGVIEDESQNLEEKLKLASDIAQVKKALDKVRGEHKDVIIWYYLDELSIPEIAQILGKSGGAVRVMVHRGLKEARKWLK